MDDQSRRRLLAGLATGAGAAAAAAAAWPIAAAVVAPLEQQDDHREAPWVDVAGLDELRPDAPLKATLRIPVRDGFFTTLVDAGAVWLIKRAGALLALSATCPHLGCGIGRTDAGFVCPCHSSQFAPDGAYVKGPSPRSMVPLPVKSENGRVLVQALRFATGTKQRRPA